MFWDNVNQYSIRENPDSSFAGIWFQTRGCTYDRSGGCTMCDYSAGPETDDDTMVKAVQQALGELHQSYDTLLISPSGSMLDEKEVPVSARQRIFDLVRATDNKTVTFETRADSICKETIDSTLCILGDRLKMIYIGIETTSDFINKYCINKGVSMEQIEAAVQLLLENNITPVGNILTEVPMLTQKESYNVAKKSLQWCYQNNVKPALFVTHVKENTLYNQIYQLGLCSEPSLWLLVELLEDSNDENNMEICWYRTYDAFNLIKAADTCPACYEKVLKALDDYCIYRDREILRALDCDCRKRWRESLYIESDPIPERILHIYYALAKKLLGNSFWEENKSKIETMIYSEFVKEKFE